MYKMMKALAIAVLLVTIAGAGATLYAIKTISPVVEQVSVVTTPAAQAQDVFDQAMRQIADETFTGRVFGDAAGLNAEGCAFLTYTVRLGNKGFFPAEWVSLDIHPLSDGSGYDVLQLDNHQANVLASQSRGDIAATILHAGSAENVQRAYTVSCYVLGRKITFDGYTQ